MTSRSGGLLELVARGKKDVFFTSNPVTSFFHSVYMRSAAFSKEIYVTKPRNIPEWGRWVDFDIDHRGDLVRQFYLRIALPTWLPATAINANTTGIVSDPSGVTFGYCNNIGFQMLHTVQVYQDQVLIHEVYGEHLDWRLRQAHGLATTLLVSAETGGREETPLGIARSATPMTLRVPIPILGSQRFGDPGLPMVALRGQRYRIRVYLRNLEEVIVASDGRLRPNPWNMPLQIQATSTGPIDSSQTTLPKTDMKLDISLESTQIYVPTDVQVFLKSQTLRFPYQTVQFQEFTIEDNQLTAAAPPFSINFQFPIAVDFIGSVDRLLLGCRSEASTLAGQRTQLRPAPGLSTRFINSIRLNIANIDRIRASEVSICREVANYWKNCRMGFDLVDNTLAQEIYTISFGGFDYGEPVGTLNFTRATLPTLYATLSSIAYDPRNISRKTSALLYAESWNIFEIQGGKGKMMFDDS